MENNIVSVYIKKETYDLLQKEIRIPEFMQKSI